MSDEREKIRQVNPDGFSWTQNRGVDVAAAEAAYSDLERRLSSASWSSNTGFSLHDQRVDNVEDGNTSEDSTVGQRFNLEENLRGNQKAAEQTGIRPKNIGVIWEDLTVYGTSSLSNHVKTFPSAIISLFNIYGIMKRILGLKKKPKDVKILDSFRGVAKPGEMVLVLGRPGSGCTTFLKVISNQRFGYIKIDGDVLYGPFEAKKFASKYRGETVYNQEDDIHHPTLTVGQTLGFAIDLKTPSKRPAGVSRALFKEEMISTLLKMFNIEHTRDTQVGGPFMRGVSGGERKRVSIAEMITTAATICAWDNSTRGLDASTALDFVKSLRIMTNICKTTTFVSLYQASENIYQQFDKVLVIDDGQQVFFGPAQEARAYFESLGFKQKPRLTTPDFLTGCTDEFEREYTDWYLAENTPHSPETLAAAFNQSRIAENLINEMSQYKLHLKEDVKTYSNFKIAIRDSKMKGAFKNSVYTAPLYFQIWVMIQRSFLIKWQDKFNLTVSWVTSIIIALLLGSVWLNLPTTSAGTFTRGGLLFITLIFNALLALSELGSTMMGRSILNRHKAFTFYRPSALTIANIAVDFAFSALRTLVFCIIVYFMCGLVLEPGAFFIFYLVIILGYLALALVFRSLGFICPDFDYAMRLSAVIITMIVVTSGYVIQLPSQRPWLKWAYYINPVSLGFKSLIINEFRRLTLTCTSESLIPSGPGYNSIANQVCTLLGSVPGTDQVAGSSHLKQMFSYNPDELGESIGIIIAIIAVMFIICLVLGELVTWGAGGNSAKVFQKGNKERKNLNMALIEKRMNRRNSPADVARDENIKIESKAILTWENLCYNVPTPSGQLRLLNNIYGYVRPGSLTALMGASGAGKTTLLDVLASRKTTGVISGDLLLDGIKPGNSFQRGTSYAEQIDICEPTQTVREALRFSADLRQSFSTPQSDKYAYVEEVISLLEMEDLADAIIGDPETGLSVEQRKRVTIGVELAAKPELMLFLDEPTSGLDSQSAFNIVRFLQKLAGAGQAILCTIHQPTAALFENFDRLLLLQRGGQTVYFGEIGRDAVVLRSYFAKYGAHCPLDANVAEWMLEAIGAGQAARIGNSDWADIWARSDEFNSLKESITQMKTERINEGGNSVKAEEKEFATPFFHQLKIVLHRTNLSFWRSPNYGFTLLFNHFVIAFITGIAFLNLDNSQRSLQLRVFVIFQVCVLPNIILDQVELRYSMSRLIYYREASAKMYNHLVFALSLIFAEIPYSILCAVVFFLPLYLLPGLSLSPSRAGYQFCMIMATEFFAVTLGQLLSAITPSHYITSLLNPFIFIPLVLLCGVTIPKPQIPKYWRWLYELDPFTRVVAGMITTELHDLPMICDKSELSVFTAPVNQTCGSYLQNYLQNGNPGYLLDNFTKNCQYCHYKAGDEFYTQLGLDFYNRWREFGILIAFICGNVILLLLASKYLNFSRR
ncbi:ABC transporter G family member 11 [Golovinomyces cichoracearum]|uniref:ABC transporter G family member 11 n=1 Tax=Golovinomyces cichoracearum TaxID=62708 RepID=A0A420IKA6_9PEZI|nr:ABC transporter G family member 11 [Golovinomyces cichoracearum]